MRELSGRVAVVTGAASGIGRAFAQRLAEEGMRVVLADIEEPALAVAVSELRREEHDVTGVAADVRRIEDVREIARRAVEAYGGVHVLCDNAGVDGYLAGPLWEATDRDWEWTFGVNFWGVANGIRAFLPLMLAQDEAGHVVNTASAAGLVSAGKMYGITKHAVVALSEVVYGQLKARNAKVGVSVLCPGVVNTRLFDASRNRPPDLRNDVPLSAEAAGTAESIRRGWFERAAAALQPARVAALVLAAIRNDQFYVLTGNDWDERMEARWDNIRQRR